MKIKKSNLVFGAYVILISLSLILLTSHAQVIVSTDKMLHIPKQNGSPPDTRLPVVPEVCKLLANRSAMSYVYRLVRSWHKRKNSGWER